MFFWKNEYKVFRSVVSLIPVDMVYLFPRFEFSAKMFLHNKPMLPNISFTLNINPCVTSPAIIPLRPIKVVIKAFRGAIRLFVEPLTGKLLLADGARLNNVSYFRLMLASV